ncbi:MAG TPA: dihydropteroate synthase [Pyrinomonadaceae bacterium]|nr:dihydropteroate synthase [Pyrinomonadaceae bacterium]
MFWQTSRRKFSFKKTLVMGILNVTPDSFSDGGNFFSIDDALKQAEQLIEEGADILDIGGESTRPKSARVSAEEEIRRVVPIIEAIAKRLNIPISIDTSKAAVTEKAIEAGAEVINDISGLRFDERIGEVAARTNAGLVLMHSRGEFELMHKQMPVENILREVSEGLKWSIEKAKVYGVKKENIALDVGIGFSKTFEQNLELIAKLNTICQEFSGFPILIGTSRKSFIGKILGDVSTDERLQGSLASAAIAVWNGANIVRVHDVKASVETLKIVDIIKERAGISNPVS